MHIYSLPNSGQKRPLRNLQAYAYTVKNIRQCTDTYSVTSTEQVPSECIPFIDGKVQCFRNYVRNQHRISVRQRNTEIRNFFP